MDQIQYVGESLWLGRVGHLSIILGFVAAIFSTLAYYIATKNRGSNSYNSWKRLGKVGFIIHCISVFTIMGLIFYGMSAHMYEYKYIFEHVSDDLPMRYIFSAFWEGQEGSFMLWMFWHAVLGLILLRKDFTLQAPVMMVIAAVEIWLSSMLLGLHFGWGEHIFKLGSNPVVLIREVTQAPIFANANYLELIKGRGLNPLLQNYWMTIHPPTLFLGFAATVVPFAYAVGGLMYKEDQSWLKDVQKWALFGATILGIGILMGSLWAYEALSFGGYWAWDPVENTSLVPWIILVAGIHTNMIARSSGYSIRFTYGAYLATFLLIVYSTLLTRSGILGDTSAHAFTEMGLEWQLTAFLVFFVLLAKFLFFTRWKTIPTKPKEESIYSREFWMFIGSLVLVFSGFLIDFSSSLPVFNSIMTYFDENYVGKVIKDPIPHYNKYQIWIAVLIGILSGLTVFLRYNEVTWSEGKLKKVMTRIGAHFGVTILLTILFSRWIMLPSWQFVLLSFATIYTVVANTDYLVSFFKGGLSTMSAAMSHLGFGLMVLGTIGSGVNSFYLNNTFVFKDVFEGEEAEKYVQLIKGKPLLVRGHIVKWESDTLIGRARYYDLKFQRVDADLNVIDSFTTRPNAVYSNDFSKIAAFNPDTRHYASYDVFTCIVSLPPIVADVEAAKQIEDTLKFTNYDLVVGDSVDVGNSTTLVLEGLNYSPQHPEYHPSEHDFGVEATFSLVDGATKHEGKTALGLRGNLVYKYVNKSEEFTSIVRLNDKAFEDILTNEDELEYKDFTVQQGQSIEYNGRILLLNGFDKNLDSTKYKLQQGDIAVGGLVDITYNDLSNTITPVYIIRGNTPFGVKAFDPISGIHVRLSDINPSTETFTLRVAENKSKLNTIPLEICTNVPRSDYLVLEAKVFPAINLFWIGSILMMLGLGLAWWYRRGIKV